MERRENLSASGCRLPSPGFWLPTVPLSYCHTGGAFPLTGIYRQMGYYRHVPRSFAGAQDDGGSGKGQRPLAADSGKRTADSCLGCPLPAPGGRLPANWYLQADGSLSACTKILRCAQYDCGRREGGCLKSDVWCLNVSVLSGIPLSGQRIADSGKRTAVQLSGGRSRNAVFVFMAEGDTTTLGPKGRSPLLHNPPPSGGHNPRGQRPRPPSPLNPLNLCAQRAHHYPTGTGLPFVIYFH